jgi:uncharacterized protein
LLFIDFEDPKRLRVNGRARIDRADVLLPEYPGSQLIVHVQVEAIFPNCPRYIHGMQAGGLSEYVPTAEHVPPEPKWKTFPEFRDVLPPRDGSQTVES